MDDILGFVGKRLGLFLLLWLWILGLVVWLEEVSFLVRRGWLRDEWDVVLRVCEESIIFDYVLLFLNGFN